MLRELRAALKPRGVLFSSNPHGHDEEGWNRGRYGVYHRARDVARATASPRASLEIDALLSPAGIAARAAAVARDRLAESWRLSIASSARNGEPNAVRALLVWFA